MIPVTPFVEVAFQWEWVSSLILGESGRMVEAYWGFTTCAEESSKVGIFLFKKNTFSKFAMPI